MFTCLFTEALSCKDQVAFFIAQEITSQTGTI